MRSDVWGCLAQVWLLNHLRKYPKGFGKRLAEAYVESTFATPAFRADLRRKYDLPAAGKELPQVFQAYPCNLDQWEDAKLEEVFEYIWCCKHTNIPAEWTTAMEAFYKEYDATRHRVALTNSWFDHGGKRITNSHGQTNFNAINPRLWWLHPHIWHLQQHSCDDGASCRVYIEWDLRWLWWLDGKKSVH